MSSKQIKISDTFEKNNCEVCGCSEINQYFNLNDNFIDYNGIFYSFREILAESLDLHLNHDEGKTTEICMDCKDKVIKFYHFKRMVKEIQMNRKSILSDSIRSRRNRNQENRSKLVHNIIDIVEKYTEKCSVATIRVDEDTKILTIEPASQNLSNYESNYHHKESLLEEIPFEPQFVSMHDVSFIKQEPCFEESPSFKDDDTTIRADGDTKKLTIEPASQNQSNYESNYHHKEPILEEIPFEPQFVNMHDVFLIKHEPCIEEPPGLSTRHQHNITKRKLPSAKSHLFQSGTAAQGLKPAGAKSRRGKINFKIPANATEEDIKRAKYLVYRKRYRDKKRRDKILLNS